MRALQLAFIIIIINMSINIVASADIFGHMDMESKITYDADLVPEDAKAERVVNETAGSSQEKSGLVAWLATTLGGFAAAVNYVVILISSLSFNWVWLLVPSFMQGNVVIQTTITMLNIVAGLLIGVAIMEFILKRYGILD